MDQPPSPRSPPVKLQPCIEELLKFTLQSCMEVTLEVDLGLSKDFCSRLLNHDLKHPDWEIGYSLLEIPPHSLYQHLASALYEIIHAKAPSGMYGKTRALDMDTELEEKVHWNELVINQGSELLNEPFFTQLKDGLKTVEGRCAVGGYNKIAPGALILFNNCLVLDVQDIHRYPSFSEMLQAESLAKVLPGVKTIEEGVQVYRRFYTEEKEMSNGVLAIRVTKSDAQPYDVLMRLISRLGHEGIEALLGLSK